MNSSRLSTLVAAAALLAGCAGEKPAADTTAVVTTVAAAPQLADTALARPATPPAAVPATLRAGKIVPNVRPATAAPARDSALAGRPAAVAAPISDTAHGAIAPAQSPSTVAAAPQQPVTSPAPVAQLRAPLPYSPGERLVYDVKFSSIDVGDAVMEVLGLENVRGRNALHIRFNVKGGTFLYKVNDRYESWIDTVNLVSLRHWQQIDEGSYERQRRYEIMPERGVYRENDKPELPTVAEPLDDGSFFFFLRTIPLEVGKTYSFDRYFKPDRNPVTVTVVRRERIKVAAGTFNAIVLHPTIKAKGVFGEGGQAEIWLADDSTRMMLQMKSKLKIGSLNLYLKSIRRGGP